MKARPPPRNFLPTTPTSPTTRAGKTLDQEAFLDQKRNPRPPPLKRSSTSFSTSVIRNYGDSRERLRAAEWVQTRRSTSSLSRVRAPTTRVCSNAAKIRAAYLSRGHPHLRLKTDLGFASSRSWFMIRSRWKVSKRCFRLVQVSMKIWNCVLNKYRAISSCI